MKNIIIICPTVRDYRELNKIRKKKGYDLNYIYYGENPRDDMGNFDPLAFLEDFQREFKNLPVDGVIGTHDYPGSLLASILCQKRGLNGVGILPNILCQHKYYSRINQKQSVPEAVPDFFLIDPSDKSYAGPPYYPIFCKPVKSFFSIFAQRIENRNQYKYFISAFKDHAEKFSRPLNILLDRYSDFRVNADFLLGEEVMKGKQVTLEAYVYHRNIIIIGITDSIMYPGTFSFQRFEYPSSLGTGIQKRMADTARKFISHIGYDNGIINIEFFYDPEDGSVRIIEANARMAGQFSDLIEKVDGTNTYNIQVDISLDRSPEFENGSGEYKFAASFVLRSLIDRKIIKIPGKSDMEKIDSVFPDTRIEIYGKEGDMLSNQFQDMNSYRYGIINLGGDSREELYDKFLRCKKMLDFKFDPPL
jgi:hypothetical protein